MKIISLVGRGLRRWLEMLGENPPMSRDCGPVWREVRRLPHTRLVEEVRPLDEEAPRGVFLKSLR